MRRTTILLPAVLGCLLLAAPVDVRGEVAVVTRDNPARTDFVLMAITDHPDPIGQAAWFPIRDVESHLVLNPGGADRGDLGPDIVNRGGRPIAVWSYANGENYDIAFAEWTGGFWEGPTLLGEAPSHELDPRVAVDPVDGTVYVVWWVPHPVTDEIWMAKRTSDGSWNPPILLSGLEGGRRPSIVVHSSRLLVAYERSDIVDSTSQQIVVAEIEQNSVMTHTVLADTSRSDRLDVLVHRKGNRVWIDWKHQFGEFGSAVRRNDGWELAAILPWVDNTWFGVEQIRQVMESVVAP